MRKLTDSKRLKLIIIVGALLIVIVVIKMNLKENISRITYPDYPEHTNLQVIQEHSKINLLLITVDTLRPDYLKANGYEFDTSPTLDRIIQNGLYFTNAVTPIPRTTQALASLLTGIYPHKTNVRYLYDSLGLEYVTLAEILQLIGYKTVAVVSNHILQAERGLDRGFDIYDFGTDKRDALKTTKAALIHLGKLEKHAPFFLWIHYIDPHVPYFPPKELAVQFDPDYEGIYKYNFGEERGGTGNRAYPRELGKEKAVFHNDLTESVNEHIRRLYAADIRMTDIGISVLWDEIRSISSDNLLTVFTADHGESLGENNYYFDHGAYVYNAGIRVPLAFILPQSHPYYKRGKTDDLVSLVDILPTILDLMSIKIETKHIEDIDGRSLFPLWKDESLKSAPVFAESGRAYFPKSINRRVIFDLRGRFRCVLYKEFKLIWTPFQSEENEYELYNLNNDPGEKNNLYPSIPEAEILKSILKDWMKSQKIDVWSREPNQNDLKLLKSLGYIK